MSPVMMMSPQPSPLNHFQATVNPNFTGQVMRNSVAIDENLNQQYRLVYQPMFGNQMKLLFLYYINIDVF